MKLSFPAPRLFLVCLISLAVAFPIAIISIAKLLLLLGALAIITRGWRQPGMAAQTGVSSAATHLILLSLATMALSGVWSSGLSDEIFGAIVKHGKLLVIPVIVILIRSRQEALVALRFFMVGQIFLLASSWALAVGLIVPWAKNIPGSGQYAVFSTYLDQSIMMAVLAFVGWHLRGIWPSRFRKPIAWGVSTMALVCVFYLFQGRTGHVVAVALATLTVFWSLPRRWHLAAVIAPVVLFGVLAASSTRVSTGLTEIGSSVAAFAQSGDISTSSGTRLNLWHRSLQAMADHPLVGSGVGSWNQAFNQQEALHAPATYTKIAGNPHQEYLLWGVELGVGGIVLLIALFSALYQQSARLADAERRAMQGLVLAMAMACMFNSSLYDALIGDFFMVAIGLVLALGLQSCSPPIQTRATVGAESADLFSAPQEPARIQATLTSRMVRLWPYFGKPFTPWLVALAATIVLSLTEPLIPALLQPLLDKGFQKGSLNIWVVPVSLILLFGIRGLSGFAAQLALAKVTNHGLLALRKRMFDKLLDARLSLFSLQSSSSLANTLVYEVQTGSVLLVNALMTLARDSLSLLALVGYLMFLNWKLTLIVACLFPAVAYVMRTLSRRLYRLTKDSQDATDHLAYVVEENVLAHRDVRLQAAQDAQSQRFAQLGHALQRLSMKSTAASAAMTPLTQILAAIALSAVISVALVQSAGQTTSVGSFAAFVTAMLMLIAPIKHLSEVASPITRGLAAMERGLDLITLTPSESGGDFAKPRAEGHLRFRHASVTYPDSSTPALTQFSLDVAPGETIALVGASGSGKTTLVSLLPRFVDLSAGSIELDGHALADWQLGALRAQFALVSQHVLMLNDTIAVNVALGQVLDRDRVAQCLQAANLQTLITDLPLGMDTLVGHNAMQLSGGQRQRLAIARALYKDAPILILDEATSALDAESERAVQEALQRLMDKRTTLVIAHRLSTIQHANRIVVMDAGRIVEIGTHGELLAADGTYAQLYKMGFASRAEV